MAYLKQLRIVNFKSFSEEQTFNFSLPREEEGMKKKGLTVIVGGNNSGKSTVFDSIKKLTPNKKLPKSERHDGVSTLIVFLNEHDEETTVTNINNGNQIDISGSNKITISNFDFVNSRRHWSHNFSGEASWDQYDDRTRNNTKIAIDEILGTLLSGLNKDPKQKGKFDYLMRELVSDFRDWTIDSTEEGHSDFIAYKTASGNEHNSSLLGDGIISLFRIVSAILRPDNNKVLIIDEPELSLHPQVLKKLAFMLSELSYSRQIIICTHSPYFVNWDDIALGAQILRLIKGENDFTTVKTLSIDGGSLASISNLRDYQKPHLLDLVSKEIFFSDKVLFVEGQEDVSLITNKMKNSKDFLLFDVFGYGAGGATNIYLFLSLAKEMGIKASAIFDGDMSTEYSRCKRAFPEFLVEIWSESDIRDKYNLDSSGIRAKKNGIEKEGIFNGSGDLKPKNCVEFGKMFAKVIAYFRK